jgi:hypothetical protein
MTGGNSCVGNRTRLAGERKGSLNCIGIAYAQGNSSFVLRMDNKFAFGCIRSQHYTKMPLIFTKASNILSIAGSTRVNPTFALDEVFY